MSIRIPTTPPPTTDSIENLKREFGENLPQHYLLFLREHDGAKPESNVFNISTGNRAGIDQFIPIRESIRIRDRVEGFPRSMLPIAHATSGNYVYLNPLNGYIYFWDHENDSADIKLADSFEVFLDALQPFDLSRVELKPGQVKKVWVNPNFKPQF